METKLRVTTDELNTGISVSEILKRSELFVSMGQIRRLGRQDAISVNGVIASEVWILTPKHFVDGQIKIQVGKSQTIIVEVE